MAQLLPRYLRRQLARIEDENKIAAIILEGAEVQVEVEGEPAMALRRSADGHSRVRARGVPIVGKLGGGGASPGTDPVAALLHREARRGRRRR